MDQPRDDQSDSRNLTPRWRRFDRRRLIQGAGALAMAIAAGALEHGRPWPARAQTASRLRQRYTIAGSTVASFPGSTVQPFTSAAAYFQDLAAVLSQLQAGPPPDSFVYIANWLLDGNVRLGGSGTPTLVDTLKDLSARGVDVRVLGWVLSPDVMALAQTSLGAGMLPSWVTAVNQATMSCVEALRTEPSLADRACLNVLAHPAGAAHSKLVIVGVGSQIVGYTGGIDLDTFRTNPTWHDVQAKVTGPAVDELHASFSGLWNELRGRPTVTALRPGGGTLASHFPATMPAQSNVLISAPGNGPALVQSGETMPAFRLGVFAPLSQLLPHFTPLAVAPRGRFGVRPIWRKGVLAGSRTIYMEDQSFTSAEVMDWANAALRANPSLRVVLVGAADDPTAPVDPVVGTGRASALNEHLLRGIPAADISRRVAWFRPIAPTFVHSKTTLVDDAWAIIGSANCMRRGLYTDIEHAITTFDPNGSVAAYRARLWGRYPGLTFPAGSGLGAATDVWFNVPEGTTVGIFRREALPVTGVTLPLTSGDQMNLDLLQDVDSRTWSTPAPVVPTFSLPLVKQPELSERVRTIQFLLRAAGAGITADSDFGDGTRTAVEQFQVDANLSVDGQIGQNTWLALIIDLQRGDAGDAVRALQNQLNVNQIPLAVDGDFGPDTESAVSVFQASRFLPSTGIADLDTWLELVRP